MNLLCPPTHSTQGSLPLCETLHDRWSHNQAYLSSGAPQHVPHDSIWHLFYSLFCCMLYELVKCLSPHQNYFSSSVVAEYCWVTPNKKLVISQFKALQILLKWGRMSKWYLYSLNSSLYNDFIKCVLNTVHWIKFTCEIIQLSLIEWPIPLFGKNSITWSKSSSETHCLVSSSSFPINRLSN